MKPRGPNPRGTCCLIPDFGALSGTAFTALLNEPLPEKVRKIDVDEEGVYRQAAPQPIVLPFQLELQPAGSPDEGEWRITSAPDGIVMESNLFYASYQSTSLMFFDPTFHYLVPDQRYFPKLGAPERTVAALLRGPSADIAPAVRTAIPDGTTLQDGSVVQSDGSTTVSFSEKAWLSVNVLRTPSMTMLGRMAAVLIDPGRTFPQGCGRRTGRSAASRWRSAPSTAC